MRRFVKGPINATFPNLFLSLRPTTTAPGVINLNGIIGIAEIAVISKPYN